MMTASLKGKTKAEAEVLFDRVHKMLTGAGEKVESHELGKLAVFSGVREFPVRVKCATVAWHTLRPAVEVKRDITSTE
jgi:nitrogen fixation protein NifU and related proteins